MTRVIQRESLGGTVYGNHERRLRGLEMRKSDGGSGGFLIDDVMVDVAQVVPVARSPFGLGGFPQDRAWLDIQWTAQVESGGAAKHAYVTVQINDDTDDDYFTRVDVFDPDTNGTPFVNRATGSGDADAFVAPYIIVGFVNDYSASEPRGYASGWFRIPDYNIIDGDMTVGKQLFGQAVLGGANSDPTTTTLVQGAWNLTDPVTSLTFRIWDYAHIDSTIAALNFGQGSRFTVCGPTTQTRLLLTPEL